MEKKYTVGIFALLGVLLITAGAFAYQGNPRVQGPNYSEERHEAMQEAFESGSYPDWVNLMTEDGRHPRIVDVITEDNFAEFAAANLEALDGNTTALDDLRAELDLGHGNQGHGPRDGSGRGMHGEGKGMGNNGECPCAA